MLRTYDEFIEEVQRLGVMSFHSIIAEGFPSLRFEVERNQWHTDDPDTDPWDWRERCVKDDLLAFGCILNGRKGFLAKELFPYFYAACRNPRSLDDRYMDGKISPLLRETYKLLEGGDELSTAQIRRALGISGKESAKSDAALTELQGEFLISISGTTQKISSKGVPYGWTINAYQLTDVRYAGWLNGAEDIGREEARRHILAHCGSWGRGIDLDELAKVLFGKL